MVRNRGNVFYAVRVETLWAGPVIQKSRSEREVGGVDGREPAESLPSRKRVTNSSQNPPFVEKEAPFQNTQKSEKNTNMVIGPDGARYQEGLCWRGPAAIYWTGLEKSRMLVWDGRQPGS
jgi:hypothetical protein